MQGFVTEGMRNLSVGNKTHGLCVTQNCRFVISSFQAPGIIKCCPTLCHLVVSNPHSQSEGKPTATWRSVTLTGESFSAMKLNTIFYSPGCTGTTRQPFAEPRNTSPTLAMC